MDGRRFDVGVSNPFLLGCKQKISINLIRQSINKKLQHFIPVWFG
jgi:hypothetical protein